MYYNNKKAVRESTFNSRSELGIAFVSGKGQSCNYSFIGTIQSIFLYLENE